MSERVRRDFGVYIGAFFDVLINHSADRTSRDARALIIEKNGLIFSLIRRSVVEKIVSHREPANERLQSQIVKRHDSLLAAFAGDADELALKINIFDI